MISLSHLKNCSTVKSIPEGLNLSSKLFFCTDSRKYHHPAFFVAIPGAKVNPLDVINKLLTQACPLIVYQDNAENREKVKQLQAEFPKTSFVPVLDSVTFLQELSHLHILEWKKISPKNMVFAISGSNGKTTHKEMLGHILNAINPRKIVATEKNNNNHLGVPLTLLQVNDQTEMVVLELGSNHPGEIKVLCDIAFPDAGLTTNIGATHLEFFGSEEKVFEEEGYLYHAVKEHTHSEGFFLINKDDPFLTRFPNFKGAVTYGSSGEVDARISFLENGASIHFQGHSLVATNAHITGRHNKLNLITCVFIAHHFYPECCEQIIAAAAEFRPTKNRSEWIEFENRPVFLDAYNANPSSMKAALEGFKESVVEQGMTLDEACVVLGDMNELGDSSPQYHQELGNFIKTLGFNHVYFVGRFRTDYLKGFAAGAGRPSAADFKSEFRNEVLKKYRIHFIKGSRSLQLESLFDIT
ncbi:MAG: UDP-N-acetylmuramoyl-tripeptide--D-alanyl-D-alanine ligase [Bdellovibrionales bacterium]|nr:UDP-N-acetylmuramoyl-tripeptide--D-alanyl-D-alanine ligase [Bdellovibrionales bacterium]